MMSPMLKSLRRPWSPTFCRSEAKALQKTTISTHNPLTVCKRDARLGAHGGERGTCTMEKSSTITNCAVTRRARIIEGRGLLVLISAFFVDLLSSFTDKWYHLQLRKMNNPDEEIPGLVEKAWFCKIKVMVWALNLL